MGSNGNNADKFMEGLLQDVDRHGPSQSPQDSTRHRKSTTPTLSQRPRKSLRELAVSAFTAKTPVVAVDSPVRSSQKARAVTPTSGGGTVFGSSSGSASRVRNSPATSTTTTTNRTPARSLSDIVQSINARDHQAAGSSRGHVTSAAPIAGPSRPAAEDNSSLLHAVEDDDDWLADLDDAALSVPAAKKEEQKPANTAFARNDSAAPTPANSLIKRASRTQSRLWAERAKHAETSSRIHRSYVRCRVMAVREGVYEHPLPNSSRTVSRPEIILYGIERPRRGAQFRHDDGVTSTQGVPSTGTPAKRKIVLREEWTATRVAVGDYIHCVGNWEEREMDAQDQSLLRDVDRQVAELEQKREEVWGAEHLFNAKKEETDDDKPIVKKEDSPAVQLPLDDTLPPSSFESTGADDFFAGLDESDLAAATDGTASHAPLARPRILTMDLLSSSPLSDSIHADNLLILHPDVLVTATAVCDVPTCVRKPIVKSRINTASATDRSSEPLVMGNMLHEVLQACLTGMGMSDASRVPPLDTEEALMPYMDMPFPLKWFGPGKTDFSLGFLVRQVKLQVLNNLDGLLCCGLETMQGEEKLLELCRPFGEFSKRYLEDAMAVRGAEKDSSAVLRGLFKGVDGMLHMAGVFNEDAVILDSRATVPTLARVTHVFDVEEEIWSPMYGLKGKMDVSVEVELQETEVERPAWRGGNHFVPGQRKSNSNSNGGSSNTSAFYRRTQSTPDNRGGEAKKRYASIMPLEIKTGRSVDALEHRAQTMLYTLMMSDRYGTDVNSGLLYYSRSGDMHRVKRTRNEVRGLIVGRNELAYWIRRNGRDEEEEGSEAAKQRAPPADSNGVIDLAAHEDAEEGNTALPPGIDSERECGRCFAQDGCMLYRRALDRIVEDPDNPSEVAPLYSRITSHLTPTQAAFFEKWERLLSLEEEDMVKFKRELWTLTAAAREEVGRCFANMSIDPSQKDMGAGTSGGRVHSHTYRFLRKDIAGSPGQSLLGGSMTPGDPVVVSIEPATFSVAQGYIVDVTTHSVTIGLDHHLDAILERAAVEQGQDAVDVDGLDITFRIDRDEYSDGMAKIRAQLARLFYTLTDRAQRHRELVVDLAPPRFDEEQALADDELPEHLNEDQREAMKKVFSAQDYALVLGMPGTGKTTTIAELIKLLVARGNTILLASYTHSAVDTILRKLRKAPEVRMLRLGNIDRVHVDLKSYTLPQASTVEELDNIINTPNVIGTTCLSTGHVTFARRKFDYCIVDEASQITLPTCLGPLRFADKFVLVGDHFQLPPLVRNNIARKGGLDVSLFKRLSEAHKPAVVYLTRQYRMNESIMLLSNHLIYDGMLKCGNEQVAKQVLKLPRREFALDELHSPDVDGVVSSCTGACWIERLLAESSQAVFVDTDAIPGHESRRGRMVQNEIEASIIQQLSRSLVLSGVPKSDIAVITPYRQQLKLLNSLLLPHTASHSTKSTSPAGEIEIMTADRSQGRDKPIVLISLVRSNTRKNGIGELLNDWRRINVALTRAQRKVIIVGSQSTLSAAPLLEDFFALMKDQGWILRLPRGATEMHPCAKRVPGVGVGSSQGSSVARSSQIVKKEHAHSHTHDENISPHASQSQQSQRNFIQSSTSSRTALDELQQPSSQGASVDRKRKRAGSSRHTAIDLDLDVDSDEEEPADKGKNKIAQAVLRRRPVLRDAVFAEFE